MIYPPNQKPLIWSIDPGIVAYNCCKYGMPHPMLAMPMWVGAGNRAFDLSGHKNHGALTGQPDWVADGLDFNGSSDFVDLPTIFNGASSGTIFIYTKPTSIGAVGYIYCGGSYQSRLYLILRADGKISGRFGSQSEFIGTTVLDVDNWYRMALTWDGSDGILYLDGQVDGTGTSTTAGNTLGEAIGIYQEGGIKNSFYHGIIANAYLFNTALSAAQIKFLCDDPYFMYQMPEELYGYVVSGGIEVSATTDPLLLTENIATVNAEISFTAGIDALSLTEYAAIVNAEVSISAGVDALILTENIATVNAEISFTAGIDALTLTEYQATINAKVSISAGIDILTLTENIAEVNTETNISASVDTLTLSSFTADIKVDINIQAILETLVIAEYSASVAIGTGSTKFISEQLGLNQIQGLF